MSMQAETPRRRMLVICPFPQGVAAGQRLKYEQYFDDWRAAGYDIEVSSYMDMAMWKIVYLPGNFIGKALGVLRGHMRRLRDLFRVARYDVVYVFMYVTPIGTTVMEKLVRGLARRMIVDMEDNVLTEQSMPAGAHPNAIVQYLKGSGKARYLIGAADHVITSSPFLNDFCLDINRARACTYISSSIDTDRFVPTGKPDDRQTVTVGWTGTFSSKIYLDILAPVFQELAKRVDYQLTVIGNFKYDLPGVKLKVIQWTKEREVEDLQTFDIGVYPLPVDDWVLGKSGLKAIQYMCFGLPTVATAVGTTPMIIRSGENGILVREPEEWLAALEQLIRDPGLRKRLGAQARKDALANYSTHVIAAQYRHVLEQTWSSTR
ncbi:MAG: glycosyltransferase family 4 protein [Rhodoblastus sp.]